MTSFQAHVSNLRSFQKAQDEDLVNGKENVKRRKVSMPGIEFQLVGRLRQEDHRQRLSWATQNYHVCNTYVLGGTVI